MSEAAEVMPAVEQPYSGIPKDPKEAAEAVKSGVIKVTEKPDDVPSGDIIGTFTINVQSKDKDTGEVTVHYSCDKQPFIWKKVAGLAGVFEEEGAPLTEDQVTFLSKAFEDAKQGAVITSIVDLYNSSSRDKAKASEYQRINNLYMPYTEEDKAKALDLAIKNIVKGTGLSYEAAKALVAQAQAQK